MMDFPLLLRKAQEGSLEATECLLMMYMPMIEKYARLDGAMDAVSYTHLDVYKRQAQLRVVRAVRFPGGICRFHIDDQAIGDHQAIVPHAKAVSVALNMEGICAFGKFVFPQRG